MKSDIYKATDNDFSNTMNRINHSMEPVATNIGRKLFSAYSVFNSTFGSIVKSSQTGHSSPSTKSLDSKIREKEFHSTDLTP